MDDDDLDTIYMQLSQKIAQQAIEEALESIRNEETALENEYMRLANIVIDDIRENTLERLRNDDIYLENEFTRFANTVMDDIRENALEMLRNVDNSPTDKSDAYLQIAILLMGQVQETALELLKHAPSLNACELDIYTKQAHRLIDQGLETTLNSFENVNTMGIRYDIDVLTQGAHFAIDRALIPSDNSSMDDVDDVGEYARQAHTLVDNVIESAIKKLEQEHWTQESEKNSFEMTPPIYLEPKFEDYDVDNINWLTINEFTPEKAEQKIYDFIDTWEYQDSWKFCIDYLGKDKFEFDTRHRFRVRWSIPTRRKPIPSATACVYFTFDVSKVKPKNFKVDVFYVFETNRLVHKPGLSRFREKWLKDIIESKVMVMSQIAF